MGALCVSLHYFNSRPSARGDAEVLYGYKAEINFNSRPSARGDARWNSNSCVKFISIHAPPRGATSNSLRASAMLLFQFTLLREGRRKGWNDAKGKAAEISIHAPPRGATRAAGVVGSPPAISIHAPPRGATRRSSRCCRCCSYFNSRPSARGDSDLRWCRLHSHISIHAPPRGATGCEDKGK